MFTFNSIHRFRAGLIILLIGAFVSSCIENDIPYPKIQPNFTSFEVENQLRASVIDSASRTVTVYLNEEADICHLKVLDWGVTSNAIFPDSSLIDGYVDLSKPLEVTMSVYQDYVWTISAVQDIERYFKIASEVGSAEIDPDAHTVKAKVPTQLPLTDVEVRSMKLAGPLATYSPSIVGQVVDFSSPVAVDVEEFGRTTRWTITIEQTDVSVELTHVDAWTCVAWLYAQAESGKTNGFEYRLASADDWTVVPEQWITNNGGAFSARLIGLLPETEYVARATSDDESSVEIRFTTASIIQLPNSDFTSWWLDGKIWCPWASGDDPFWGTGNKGATTLGASNTLPYSDPASATGYSGAILKTEFRGIGALGKLAAGNLFAGSYVRTEGTDGVLSFGRPFTGRPTKLVARLKYTNATISDASTSNPDFKFMKGQPDTCIVWCALVDSEEPVEIRTKKTDRKLFDRNAADVIAYGQFESGVAINDYIDVTIDLDYVSTSRVPRYILVTASASKYGDYFTGGRGSTLWIESYNLLYDY